MKLKKPPISYSKTLNLPNTLLSIKPITTPENTNNLINQSSTKLYNWQFKTHANDNLFILHDGPPYANGDLHMGHSLNKILKDIINRFELIYNSKKIYYKPGWDCHGLPIELKSLAELSDTENLTSVEIRERCGLLASETIKSQMNQFKELGILTNWDDHYKTLSKGYETNQLNFFQKLFKQKLISRQKKPVFWGIENKTALAESELEYQDRKIVSLFISFPVTPQSKSTKLESILQKYDIESINLLIWTSTPWTIGSNQAICINESLDYTIIRCINDYYIIETDLASKFMKTNVSFSKINTSFKGSELLNIKYTNPLFGNNIQYPVLHGDHVTNSMGTGLVHTAPGHGNEDYLIGIKNNLKIFSPVDNNGRYTPEIGIPELIGLNVLYKGTKQMFALLAEKKMIISDLDYTHSYPHDWRSKKPVIIRATDQWFINVSDLKSTAIDSLNEVEFIPKNGANRLMSFIKNRNEWCISRQRCWGVPIPMIYHKDTGDVLQDDDIVLTIIEKLNEFGTNEWFVKEDNISRWLPQDKQHLAYEYVKGKDTMDVWFDSGTSWNVIQDFLTENKINRDYLADVYLEGSDQHRGWFQSSLLNKIAVSSQAPFRKIITHGFILDSKSKKMSKSLGNIIKPNQVINGKDGNPGIGVDGLRLWVASADYTSDVVISPIILKHIAESLRKFRSTFRYILGNINDYDGSVPEKLSKSDQLALSKLYKMQKTCIELYKNHDYPKMVKEISKNMNIDLSARYFDISKDILYTESSTSDSRKSIQYVFMNILKTYIGLMSPILPLLTQETWNFAPHYITGGKESPFMNPWSYYQLPDSFQNTELEKSYETIDKITSLTNLLIEKGRSDKVLKTSLENSVTLKFDNSSKLGETIQLFKDELSTILLVSQVSINPQSEDNDDDGFRYEDKVEINGDELAITLRHSSMHKCPRCWKYTSESEEELCKPCDGVIQSMN